MILGICFKSILAFVLSKQIDIRTIEENIAVRIMKKKLWASVLFKQIAIRIIHSLGVQRLFVAFMLSHKKHVWVVVSKTFVWHVY